MSIAGDARPSAYLAVMFPGADPRGSTSVRALATLPDDERVFLALPDVSRARMLLPSEPRLAAVALRRARRTLGWRGELETRAAVTAVRTGVGRLLDRHLRAPRSGRDAEAVLSSTFGTAVRVAAFLGPPRANRKPVLQVMDEQGGLLGIAKMAVNELTHRLVVHEGQWLAQHAGRDFGLVTVPRLVGQVQIGDATTVIQSPLDVPIRTITPPDAVLRAGLMSIARIDGVREEEVGESQHAQGLRERLDTLPEALHAPASRALDVVATRTLPYGSWHGDLSPWNVAWTDEQLLVWDWERATAGVPLGMDAMHYWFMPRVKASAGPNRAGVELLDAAPALLSGWDVDGPSARGVALLYLLDVATRFAGDGQARTGVRAGDVGAWLVPALREWSRIHRG